MSVPIVDLMNPDFTRNPAKAYGRLREQAPVVPVRFPGMPKPMWLITRYDEVKSALTDPRFVLDPKNVPGTKGPSITQQMMTALGAPAEYMAYLTNMLSVDGKDHTRLRVLVAPAFGPRRMAALRPRVEQVTRELVTLLKEKGDADLVKDFAVPLSSITICELIGIDAADQQEMSEWIHHYSNSNPANILESVHHLVEYTKNLIKRRRSEPGDDLISKLINTVDENGDRLSDDEAIAMVLLLIHTGHQTTSHFVPNSALAFFDHPDQLARLRAEPALLPRAVNELMRFASPVSLGVTMYATEDIEFADAKIRRGDTVTACLSSANHDPRNFSDPERFDITRALEGTENHLALYHGPHYCLGAALARVQSEIALDHLFLRLDGLSLAIDRDRIQYQPNPGASVLVRLPVRV